MAEWLPPDLKELIQGQGTGPSVDLQQANKVRMLRALKKLQGSGQVTEGEMERAQKAKPSSMKELIAQIENPRLIETMIEGSSVPESVARLGMAKLHAIDVYGTGKGRIHEYADGAQEWVPEGMAIMGIGPFMIREGPTTGGDEMATRGGGLQQGGLAAALTGVGRDSDADALTPTSRSIVSDVLRRNTRRFANGGSVSEEIIEGVMPDPVSKAIMNLEEARSRLGEMQGGSGGGGGGGANNTDRWLALAQGMLAPTKTGGFGESISMSAGLLLDQRQKDREMDLKRETAAKRFRTKAFEPELFEHPTAEGEFAWGIPRIASDGTVLPIEYIKDKDGDIPFAQTPLSPQQITERIAAKEAAQNAARLEFIPLEAWAKLSVAAQTELRPALETANMAIRGLNEMRDHPGLKTATGVSAWIDPQNLFPASDAFDFSVRHKQLAGSIFLEAFQGLKGGGQITELEGEKATQSIARMETAQSEGEYLRALDDYEDIIRRGYKRLFEDAQGGAVFDLQDYNPRNLGTMPPSPVGGGEALTFDDYEGMTAAELKALSPAQLAEAKKVLEAGK